MERRRERSSPPDPLELLVDVPLRLIRELGLGVERAVETLDRRLWELDEVLNRPLDVPAVPRYRVAGSAESSGIAMSPSYPGQSPTDYCLECLPAGTIVYGNHGLYPIESLAFVGYGADALVLTHRGRGRRVTRFFKRRYTGPLVVIHEYYTNIPLRITPEHPVLVARNVREPQTVWRGRGIDESRLEWVPARDLTTRDFIAFPRIRETVDVELVSGDLAELFGWYVAEGSYERHERGINVVFSLGHHEGEKIERVCELIRRLFGREPTVITKGTAVRIVLSSKYFGPMFEQFGTNSYNKDIPTWFLYLPEEKQYRFLRGYFGGDGHVRTRKRREGQSVVEVSAATVSSSLAYRLRLLLFRLGILHSVHLRSGGEGEIQGRRVRTSDTYHIHIAGESAMRLLEKMGIRYEYTYGGGRRAGYNLGWVGESYVFIPIRSIEIEHFDGEVYNLHVDEDESYLTIHGALHNCLQRHFTLAHGLLEEAERFSLKHGRITPEAREKIRRAVEEIITAEDDMRVVPEDREMARLLDEIKIMQRDLRKWMWTRGLPISSESLDDLREAKRRLEELIKKTYEAAEIYRRRYGTCPACESLAEEVSEKFGVSKSEILEALHGLASDDRERVRESARRLRELGVLDYIIRRTEEMLREMRGGGGGQA
ncbi:MAG: LAGLIDADG family homing endonuclease [Thermofilum sp.]